MSLDQLAIEYRAELPTATEFERLYRSTRIRPPLPFKFGDSGTGHLTQCETHRNLVAFGPACN